MIPASERNREELEIAYRRYETVRKMNAREFASLCSVNRQGIPFDTLVDSVSEHVEDGKPMGEAVDDIVFRTLGATEPATWHDVALPSLKTCG